jgi:hypothetical protein
MRDEGHTEVEAGAATMYVCEPFLHRDRPKLLDNKKLRMVVELPRDEDATE